MPFASSGIPCAARAYDTPEQGGIVRLLMASALVALLSAPVACAEAALPPAGEPDRPVPPSEPRATLDVLLDLPRRVGCEGAFELALYTNRGIELVEWQGDGARDCTARRAKVRFLPARLSRDKAIALIRSVSMKMEVLAP
jgi:hypothetical protein